MTFREFCGCGEWFTTEDLKDGIYLIKNPLGVEMYLVEGDEKAALLDTGLGIGNLKKTVRNLTEKPVEVYLTHGHVDHGGGIYGFDKAWVPEGDIELLRWHTKAEFRLDFAAAYAPELKEIEDIQDYMPYKDDLELCMIRPGDKVGLGNRTLTVVNLKGHTHGSVGYYDDRTKTLFAGDGCNNSTFLFLKESSTVAEYKEMLLDLQKEWMWKVDRMFICHDYAQIPVQVVEDLIECCDMVLNGNGSDVEFIMPYEPLRNGVAMWAADGENHREDVDGKIGNLIYHKI